MRRIRFAAVAASVLVVSGLTVGLTLGARRSEAAPPGLSNADLDAIVAAAVTAANATGSGFRTSPTVQPTKMQIAIVARDGRLLRLFSMPDAWVGSIDIAIAKARTAAFLSSDQNALTSRIIGNASQPGGPLWGIGNSNQLGISGSQEFRNGIITFPGGVPLYKNGELVGGVGVSGDGVDQDEHVAFAGAAGFPPGPGVSKLGF
ncbi:MAG TPA: heme-binding protein [Gemmatimonadaceae bacterium]|jgi:uncharacterized protein GlcG (DUF336 family)|nr:heme-binding protein [Gemmatimonadaceae bacterium]